MTDRRIVYPVEILYIAAVGLHPFPQSFSAAQALLRQRVVIPFKALRRRYEESQNKPFAERIGGAVVIAERLPKSAQILKSLAMAFRRVVILRHK